MLKIRLSRVGKKNNAAFRIVVTEHYKPVKAGFIEHIGFYNPQSKKFEVNKEKLDAWMKKGATCSTTVNNLLVREKIFAEDKVVKVTRVPKPKEEEKTETREKKPAKSSAEQLGGPASMAAKRPLGGGEKKTKAKTETPEKKEKKEKTKAETKEEKKAEDKKPEEKEVKEKIEEKKPEVDKK